ncbi:hypothetical protein [Prescottella equi]|uniref:hypothetical protein n=1 Tax=Rhodococcus hoagii TaxID=43767 RepID=UPI001EEC6F10|nr:hypothetical protein [Prescottella equi]
MTGTWVEKGELGGGGGGVDFAAAVELTSEMGGPAGPPMVNGPGAIAAGYGARSEAEVATAYGAGARAAGMGGAAFGQGAVAGPGVVASAFGGGSRATADGAAAFGYYANATGMYALALAPSSYASGDFSIAMGMATIAAHANSFVFGLVWDADTGEFVEGNWSTAPNQVVLGTRSHDVIVRGTLVLQSPNGSHFAINVDDSGALTTTPVDIPTDPPPIPED